MDEQYDKEKVGVLVRRLTMDPESDEAVLAIEQIDLLKKKEQVLRESSSQELRHKLETLFDKEDRSMEKSAIFKGDEVGIKRVDFPSIKVGLREPRPKKKHVIMMEWLDLYRSQPWLAKQTAEEQRHQKDRDDQRYEISKGEALLQRQRQDVEDAKAQVDAFLAQIADLKKELDDPETPETRRYTCQNMITEKKMSIENGAEDLERRELQVEKRERKVSDQKAKLAQDEEEAHERLRKQNHARSQFEKQEDEYAMLRLEKLREEVAQIDKMIGVLMSELESVELEREGEEVVELRLSIQELKDRAEDPYSLDEYRETALLTATQKEERLVEVKNQLDDDERELKEELEDMVERKADIEAIMKGMDEMEERMAKYKEAATKEEWVTEQVQKLRDVQIELLDQKVAMQRRKAERDQRKQEEEEKRKQEEEEEKRKQFQEEEATRAIRELGVGGIFGIKDKKENIKLSTRAKKVWRKFTGGEVEDPERVAMINSIHKNQKIKTGKAGASLSLVSPLSESAHSLILPLYSP